MDRRDFLHRLAVAAVPLTTTTTAQVLAAEREVAAPAAAPAVGAAGRLDVPARINAELKAHGAIFERRIHRVGDNVYAAVGWSGCNTVMVEGTDGIIIVDTGDNLQSAREVAAEFLRITDKPVRAVIYTCFHIDHIAGVKGFVSAEDVSAGRVAIIAHETLLANVIKQSGTVAPILGPRTVYHFGLMLEGADAADMNTGTGPWIRRDREVSFIAPTQTFARTLDITVAGVAMRLLHVPSEAADEIAVFLPSSRILLSSEVIPAQHFPALHPLRGEAFRDPVDWYRSIDALRRLGATALVPAHGVPVVGPDLVEEVMVNVRDAIQFVHDQAVRHMNKGFTPDELAEAVRLPPHLAAFKPWLQEFFGSVSQSVRAIYQNYLGWFEGDAVAIAPTPPKERARREVALMGGREPMLAAAVKAFVDGDPQWAAELATRLVRIDQSDVAARAVKAAAFRQLGYDQVNAIWRNWYLSAARELDGFDLLAFLRANARGGFAAPDLVAALPGRAFVEGLCTRLKAEDTLDVSMAVGFRFPDTSEDFCLRLRRGVAALETAIPDKPDLMLTLDKSVLDRIRAGRLTMRDAIAGGQARVSNGTPADVARFFGYFETPLSAPVRLVVR